MEHKVNSLSELNMLKFRIFFFSLNDCHTKVKKLSLPFHFPTAGQKIVGFIPFPRVIAL